jgi:hypothetical protein
MNGNQSGHVRAFFTCDTTYATLNETACFSYTLPSGNATYTTSGTYMDTIANYTGCDSIITINLTIDTVDIGVSISGITLTANATGANYQWLDCNNAMAPISGEMSQSFVPTANGNYAVEVTQNGCIDTSACYAITTIGLVEDAKAQISVYPNPTKGTFVLQCAEKELPITATLYHISGKMVFSRVIKSDQTELNISGPVGMYLLKLETGNQDTTVLRLIKR